MFQDASSITNGDGCFVENSNFVISIPEIILSMLFHMNTFYYRSLYICRKVQNNDFMLFLCFMLSKNL